MQNENKNIDILKELLNSDNDLNSLTTNSSTTDLNSDNDFDVLKNFEIEFGNQEKQLNQEKQQDVLSNLINNIDNEILEIEKKQIQETQKESFVKKVLKNIMFFTKYIFVSSFIFIFLLGVTNYSAYMEIAKSYLNPEILEQNKQLLLASVNSTNIDIEKNNKQIEKNNKQEEEIKIKEDKQIELVKNKTFHSMEKLFIETKDLKQDLSINIVPYENRIVIPKIGKNVPLVDIENKKVKNVKDLESIFMKELVNGIVRYPGTARPGEVGNSFIFGHSSNFPWLEGKYNDVFALMDNLVFGDEIIAYYNQKKYVYKVKEKKIVKPGNVSVLKRKGDKKEISLMTCWPIGTTLNRMIVIGELVEEK